MTISVFDRHTHFDQPIVTSYPQPTAIEIDLLRQEGQVVPLLSQGNIVAINQYYQDGLPGTDAQMYTRLSVLKRLHQIAEQLLPHYGLLIFDTYRSIRTQQALFDDFTTQVRNQHPDWNEADILQETLRFVSHPTDPGHYPIPLHNSGGAVDLAICDLKTHTMLDFGTTFDAISDASATQFFEQDYQPGWGITQTQWLSVRTNRRVLYNLMKSVGFINYHNEWWHYDLGDCYWAKVLGIDWVYDRVVLDS